jgi:hypothetical protein
MVERLDLLKLEMTYMGHKLKEQIKTSTKHLEGLEAFYKKLNEIESEIWKLSQELKKEN